MSLLDSFLIRATLAAIGVALAAAPLGCFVVWRRMAYFGDATAHAAILGVAISIALSMPIFAGVLLVAFAMALIVTGLEARAQTTDSSLGVLSYSALAFGLVAMAALPGVRIDPEAFLFGDILAVSRMDLAVIWLGAAAVLALLWLRWSALLTATLNGDLAQAAGINPRREQLILTLAMALVVAVSIKVVGVLLIGAMLIIPASAARPLARTPEAMALWAIAIACMAALGGLGAAYHWDTQAGPTIVCCAALLFALSQMAQRVLKRSDPA
ncbi:MAG: metal ABC transporter permease [Pseudomonadota bacterium]